MLTSRHSYAAVSYYGLQLQRRIWTAVTTLPPPMYVCTRSFKHTICPLMSVLWEPSRKTTTLQQSTGLYDGYKLHIVKHRRRYLEGDFACGEVDQHLPPYVECRERSILYVQQNDQNTA